jgi:hypothetical protein
MSYPGPADYLCRAVIVLLFTALVLSPVYLPAILLSL